MNQHAAPFPHEFVKEYLSLLADTVPGSTTLNQIRILHYVAFKSGENAGYTSHTEICHVLDISPATVSRAVATYIDAGVLVETPDPVDARKRCVSVNAAYFSPRSLERKITDLAQQHFRPG